MTDILGPPAILRPLRSDHAKKIQTFIEAMRDEWPSDLVEELYRTLRLVETNADALAFLRTLRWMLTKKLKPGEAEIAHANRRTRRAARRRAAG